MDGRASIDSLTTEDEDCQYLLPKLERGARREVSRNVMIRRMVVCGGGVGGLCSVRNGPDKESGWGGRKVVRGIMDLSLKGLRTLNKYEPCGVDRRRQRRARRKLGGRFRRRLGNHRLPGALASRIRARSLSSSDVERGGTLRAACWAGESQMDMTSTVAKAPGVG